LVVGAISEENKYKVRVYENGKPVTAAVYSVEIEAAFDAKMRGFPLELVDELMQIAKDDVIEGRIPLTDSKSS